MNRRLSRRFLVSLFLVVMFPISYAFSFASAQDSTGKIPADSLGYYYMSSHYIGIVLLPDTVKSDQCQLNRFDFDSCFTVIHGPYHTKIRARRALRIQKRKEKDFVYYTQIFKL